MSWESFPPVWTPWPHHQPRDACCTSSSTDVQVGQVHPQPSIPASHCLSFPLIKEKRGLTLVLGWKSHLLNLCDHAPCYSLRGMCSLHPNPATSDDFSLHPPWVMSQFFPAPWCLGGPAGAGDGAPACSASSASARPQAVPAGPCPIIQCQGKAGRSASAWKVPVARASSRYAGAGPSSSSSWCCWCQGSPSSPFLFPLTAPFSG